MWTSILAADRSVNPTGEALPPLPDPKVPAGDAKAGTQTQNFNSDLKKLEGLRTQFLPSFWQELLGNSSSIENHLKDIFQQGFLHEVFNLAAEQTLHQGLEHLLGNEMNPEKKDPATPECKTTRDASGNILKECTLKGNFK